VTAARLRFPPCSTTFNSADWDTANGANVSHAFSFDEFQNLAQSDKSARKKICGAGSATAGDRLGGVRPSSGAAMSERERAPMESDASEQPVLAAPEDGRTPITL